MEILEIYRKFKECGSVSTDTRSLKGGEMFFALKGENFDGNEYALKALEAGAAYAVVDRESAVASSCDPRLVKVEDTLKTLQDLARWHRSMTIVDGKPLTVIALTGTNGKTTTKELIREVLSVKYRVTATEGNLNNSIGVPLTLLKISSETQLAVVEMGASHPGDIKELVEVALPDYGLITNVGKAHLLGFGSFEGVMNTKGELYDYLRRTSDKVFINVDNPHLCRMASERNLQSDPERPYSLLIPYGVEYHGAVVLPSSPQNPFLRIEMPDGAMIQTNLVGAYNADNVMAALEVGRHFGVSFEEASAAIAAYVPSNNRSQMVRTETNTLIVDAYNANPTSMEAALTNFSTIEAQKKVALLGDMLELGEESLNEHVKVLLLALGCGLDKICLVGKEFRNALGSLSCAEAISFLSSDELAIWLEENPVNDSAVLIKGSRGTRMEKVIQKL
jgi:UDP-N-acetylmuramoyl-tripeptide--D-alanyl-D-alanine ligase